MAETVIEQLGLLGVLLAGAVPWLEAVVVIPVGIAAGLPLMWTMIFALVGNVTTIVLFAAGSGRILDAMAKRRKRKGKVLSEANRIVRAKRIFVRYGDGGIAIAGPFIGTQFAAAISVSLGVSVWRSSVVQSLGAIAWGGVAAYATSSLLLN